MILNSLSTDTIRLLIIKLCNYSSTNKLVLSKVHRHDNTNSSRGIPVVQFFFIYRHLQQRVRRQCNPISVAPFASTPSVATPLTNGCTHVYPLFRLPAAQYSEKTGDLAKAMDFLRLAHAEELDGYSGENFRYMLGILNAARSSANGSRPVPTGSHQTSALRQFHSTAATNATTPTIHRLRRRRAVPPPPPPPMPTSPFPPPRIMKPDTSTFVAVSNRLPMTLRRQVFRSSREMYDNRINQYTVDDDGDDAEAGSHMRADGTEMAAAAGNRQNRPVTGTQRTFDIFVMSGKKRMTRTSSSPSAVGVDKLDENQVVERRTDSDDVGGNAENDVVDDDDIIGDVKYHFRSAPMSDNDGDDELRRAVVVLNDLDRSRSRTDGGVWADDNDAQVRLSSSVGEDEIRYHLQIDDVENVTSDDSLPPSVAPLQFGKTYVDMLLKIAHLLHYIGIGILTFFVVQV